MNPFSEEPQRRDNEYEKNRDSACFSALVVYGILAGIFGSSVIVALATATAVTLIIGWADLKKRMILSWANLVVFGSVFMAVGILGMTGIIPYMDVLIYTTLTIVTSGSLSQENHLPCSTLERGWMRHSGRTRDLSVSIPL